MQIPIPTTAPMVVVSASIGAGHDGTAAEITRRLRLDGIAVRRFDYLDLLPAGWGPSIKQTYARQLAYAPASWGWLLGVAARPAAARPAAWLAARAAQRRLLAAVGPSPAAMVSTYPLASQALGRLRLAGLLHAPAVAVLTDPSVHPLCVAAGIDLHLAPNDEAAAVVREVVVCGRNTALRHRLAATGRVIALGWVGDMPSLLRAADVVVQNAGGLTSLEATATGIPVVSYRCLPGHWSANAAVLERLGLAVWPRTPLELAAALVTGPTGRYATLGAAPDAAALIRALTKSPVAA